MKSKRTKPAPPKKGKVSDARWHPIPDESTPIIKGTALRPYGISDFIEEMKSPMPLIDIVSRVHLLTGFNKSAVIMLRRYCGLIMGPMKAYEIHKIWIKKDYERKPWNQEKTYETDLPPDRHIFLIDFLDALIVGRDVDPFFTGIDPDDYDHFRIGETKLTIRQIALICRFNGRNVTKKDAAKIAREYGHKGSTKLYDDYRNTKTPNERITWAGETEKNRIQFEAIRPHLNDAGKAMWNDELEMIGKRKQ